jgi:hypothetical protein
MASAIDWVEAFKEVRVRGDIAGIATPGGGGILDDLEGCALDVVLVCDCVPVGGLSDTERKPPGRIVVGVTPVVGLSASALTVITGSLTGDVFR